MTIQQLKCFVTMSEVLHYTKAAELLHVSQPSLSYSVSELEKELGLILFERRDNKTFLTRYGEEILPFANAALEKVDEIRIKVYELADPASGTINLGNMYSISFDFIPKILELFYAKQENHRITINFFQALSNVMIDKLMDGSLDLVISGKSNNEAIQSTYIFTQELKLIVPINHHLAGLKEVTIKQVKDEGFISVGEGSNLNDHITQCFQSRGLNAKFKLHVAECSAMGAFISSNMGIAIAPNIPSLNSNNVRIIPFTEKDRELLGRKVYLQWPKDKYLPLAVQRFRDFVIKEFNAKIT
jgi:DNA-binding transcriptional LysR family regulator